MADSAVHRASELAPEERAVVERWLGRSLLMDETVSLNTYRPHPAPGGAEKEANAAAVMKAAREISAGASDVSEGELDEMLAEAFAHVRGRRH